MLAYIVRRVLYTGVVLLVVGGIAFALLRLSPGGPAALMLGPEATAEDIRALERQMGLDRPILAQFVSWMRGVLVLDFGQSVYYKRPVSELLFARLEPTLLLTLLAMWVAVSLGVTIGVVAAARYGSKLDQVSTASSLVAAAIPAFWLGMLAISVFSSRYRLLPSSGYVTIGEAGMWRALSHLILPALCVGIPNSALLARVTRSTMLDVLSQDYVRVAKAKGLAQHTVIARHAFRNAALPVLTVSAMTLAKLIGGAVVTENVFAIPGIGRLVVNAILSRDFPVVQGVLMGIGLVCVLVNLCVDVFYSVLDPRVRY